ncbi:MAG TPA: nucleotidyltransferase family protein [Bryobacteraceae bacterium]|nr:nucleotidyltransferase family protein [Bryobacteraceae bacterium]
MRAAIPNAEKEPAAALILAAGQASRMGSLKQLLPFREGTLLSNTIRQAQNAGFDRIVVVVGAEAARVAGSIAREPVEAIENPNWDLGMGSSIRTGVKRIRQWRPLPDVIAILLADQPLIESRHLLAMRELQTQSKASIVAAQYGGGYGVPALFASDLFGELESLPPDAGARNLLREGEFPVIGYPLPEAATDIDTRDDFAALKAVRP